MFPDVTFRNHVSPSIIRRTLQRSNKIKHCEYPRHDGRVRDAQPRDAVHPQPRVDHRRWVGGRAHFARAGLMVLRARVLPHRAPPIFVARVRVLRAGLQPRVGERHVVLGQRGGVAQRQGYPDSVEEDGLVERVAQVVGVDHGLREGVVARQSKATWKRGEETRSTNKGERNAEPLLRGWRLVGEMLMWRPPSPIRLPTRPVVAQAAWYPPKKIWRSGWSWAAYIEGTIPVSCDRPVEAMGPLANATYSTTDGQFRSNSFGRSMLNDSVNETWLCRFSPTPGRSWTTLTFTASKCSLGPIPESSKI